MRCQSVIQLTFFLTTFTSPVLIAQDQATDILANAEQHLTSGRYGPAIRLLEGYLADNPRSFEVLRMLARAFYWSGNIDSARQRYEEALSFFPDNVPLRIETARFFLETNQFDRTDEVLRPLASATNAEALSLLGTARYWKGDWTGAKNYFERALDVQPDHSDARRQLNEILAATASQVTFSPEFQSDNQPIQRVGGIARYTVYITPLSPLTIQGGLSRASIQDTSWVFPQGAVSLRHIFPGSGLGIEASAGAVQISSRRDIELTYQIALSLRLPESITLKGQFEGRPYFETISSFSVPVSVTSWSFFLDRPESETWIGQAAFQSLRYIDGNTGTNVSAWFLFPVGQQKTIKIRAGYGFSLQDTRDSRFDFASVTYAPYYTPLNVISHNLLLSFQIPASNHLNFHMNGSYGLIASENLPQSPTSGGSMIPGPPRSTNETAQRSFHPWQLRMALDFSPADTPLQLQVEGTRFATAYYQVSTARLTLRYTFPVHLR
ncbi:MAG: tetratricopeptide repeat protein [Bacteroidota bacterium]